MKTTTNHVTVGSEMHIKFADVIGTLILKKNNEGILIAKWRGKMRAIKTDENCIRISLPTISVRIFESESPDRFIVDYEPRMARKQ